MQAPDYNYLSKDETKPGTDYISKWQGVESNALALDKARAEQLRGGLIQQATDPTTGVIDWNKYNQSAAAAGPAMRFAMPAGADQASAQTTAQQDQAIRHTGILGRASLMLMNDPSDANLDQVRTSLLNAGLPASQVEPEVATMRAMSEPQRRDYAIQHGLAAMDMLSGWKHAVGETALTTVGDKAVPVTTQPAMPGRPASATVGPGGVSLGLTPGEQTGQVKWVDNNGVPQQGTPEQYRASTGQPPPVGGQQIPTNPNAPPGTPPGRVNPVPANPALRNPPAAPAATPPAATPAPAPGGAPATTAAPPAVPVPGTPIAGPAPGMAEKWDASAKQYTQASQNAGNYQARIQPLVSARAILEGPADLTTGKGAEAVNNIKSVLQTVITGLTPFDIQTIGQAKFDELGKYFQQAVNSNPFAAASDARLASAIGGSPNMHMASLANKEVLKGMIGLERMQQMAFSEFQRSGKSPAQYSDFQSDWQASHDPRAFVMDMLDGAHRDKVLAGLKTPAERTAFQNSLNLIKANPGLMTQAPMTQ